MQMTWLIPSGGQPGTNWQTIGTLGMSCSCLPVAVTAFLSSLSDSVPDLSTSVRWKMSWLKRERFRQCGFHVSFIQSSDEGILLIVLPWTRWLYSKGKEIPLHSVCLWLRTGSSLRRKFPAQFLPFKSSFLSTRARSQKDQHQDTSISATMLWHASRLKPPDFKSPGRNWKTWDVRMVELQLSWCPAASPNLSRLVGSEVPEAALLPLLHTDKSRKNAFLFVGHEPFAGSHSLGVIERNGEKSEAAEAVCAVKLRW